MVLGSDWLPQTPHPNRFGSFAPVWDGCEAKWYIDGEDYMSAVADAIEAASKEIFITDWQLSPHIFMKRPDTGVDSLTWRLDKMLLRKADQGVRVYILLYWESEKIAEMFLGSEFAQKVLNHTNIEVLRHPDHETMLRHPISGTGLWSHHEKVVVVDQSIAFVGGIDLCFGRWDTHKHKLTDNYPHHPCAVSEKEPCDVVEKESCDAGEKESCDTGEKESCDAVEKESCDTGEKESCDAVEKESCDTGEKESCDAVEKESCDAVEKESCDTGEKESCDAVEKESCDTGEKESCDAVEKESCDTGEKESCDAVEKESCDTGEKESCDAVEKESCDAGEKESCDAGEKESCDAVYCINTASHDSFSPASHDSVSPASHDSM